MRQRSPWKLVIVGLVIVALAVAIRLYAGPIQQWLIDMHGGGPPKH